MRVYKRINDVYEVELPDCKKYFQFLQSDSALLGGDVIAIFNEKYDISNNTVVFLPAGTHYRYFFNKSKESRAVFINYDLTAEHSNVLLP